MTDDQAILLFKGVRAILRATRPELDFIEIKKFLALAGRLARQAGSHAPPPEELEVQFGRVFARLGWDARKGRDSRRFVRLTDRFGVAEPFVLIRLQEAL